MENGSIQDRVSLMIQNTLSTRVRMLVEVDPTMPDHKEAVADSFPEEVKDPWVHRTEREKAR